MNSAPEITLRRILASDRSAVLGLSVTDPQAAFVEPIAETLSTTALERDNFVIVAGGEVVGFFQIDCASDAQKIPDTLELHEVIIDAAHQGKGYGKAFVFALKEFLRREYPGWGAVCLTVNCKNKGAYRLYELGGFMDTGELYCEGRSGPQHVMRLDLS
jgi:GNAT superfamily N-acetyltransferase